LFQPFAGLRVIDLSQVLAGPYATYQLALMGAEIIKIEIPGLGDWARQGNGLPGDERPGMAVAYLTQNADKRSVTIDLKTAAGLDLVKRLISTAEVFVENFTPGTAARLGLSFDAVRSIRPDIVYCSISAYGQDGPIAHRPAYDHVVQGMCGIMRTTGTPDSEPNKVGAPYIDYATGLNAAFAIVSALHQVRTGGKAVHLDVAMLDTAMLLMASLVTNHLGTGWVPRPSGNEAWSLSPSSGAFETTDGVLMIAANNDRQFRALCRAVGCPEIADDARWRAAGSRRQNAAELRRLLAARIAGRSAAAWERIFDGAGVPAARVRSLDEVLAEDQLKVRALTVAMELPQTTATAHLPSLGFKADGAAVVPKAPPPVLGADTDSVLREIGISDRALARLRADRVI
jgi:crotonobetainyl-CoA:carnitine CoA-transferase CaiB-like acyl-CoA transferase